jgi:adenylate cyclase class 2
VSSSSQETEIKLAVPDVATARRLLRAAGFRISRRRVFEGNTIFDTTSATLRRKRSLLRMREAGGIRTLTYKGPPVAGKHKSREELEIEIPAARTAAAIFDRLGFHPMFRYEKYRTEYKRAGSSGVATLDETPIGVYLEIEGTPAWIDQTARQLGFGEKDYIVASYGGLYLDWCRREGCKPGDMVF